MRIALSKWDEKENSTAEKESSREELRACGLHVKAQSMAARFENGVKVGGGGSECFDWKAKA